METRDDPIADIAGQGYWAVMQHANRAGVPVMLLGQGGDELFWGYPWVRQAVAESRRKARGHSLDYVRLRRPRALGPRSLARWLMSGCGVFENLAGLRRDRRSPSERLVCYDLTPDFADVDSRLIYGSTFRDHLQAPSCDAASLFSFPQPSDRIELLVMDVVCKTYLMENGLAQADRLSMAASVESRLPLVDYRLVEKVVGLTKVHGLPAQPKQWLRAAAASVLPDWVLRRPKRGFTPPVRRWHRQLFRRYGRHVADGFLVQQGVLTPVAAQQFARGDIRSGSIVPLSFKALVLELWCQGLLSVDVPPRETATADDRVTSPRCSVAGAQVRGPMP